MRIGSMSRSSLSIIFGLWALGQLSPVSSAEKSNPTDAVPKADETNEAQQTLRSYLQLQEQLHDTLLTIERTRKETEAAARANTEAISQRLEVIEQSLGAQQNHQANLLQNSNRVTLIAAGTFAVLGLMAMIFTAWFLLRAMNRLATMASSIPARHALPPAQDITAMLSPDDHLVDLNPVEPASHRLLGAVERLEKRVHELEHSAPFSLPADASARQNGGPRSAEGAGNSSSVSGQRPAEAASLPSHEPSDGIAFILGKGQSLLSLDKPEEAIACFDEAIALDPRHAEALVKKGTALERLNRFEEAIACYDQAIAADRTMTLAYLYKGGVCNQLERFDDALNCYDQALRSQKKAV